jgi:MFS family permease
MCVSILSSIYEPTKRSIIPMIVKKEEILKANSLIETVMNALWVLGPVTGGGLITILGFIFGFLANACTFLISGFLTLGIHLNPVHESYHRNFIKEIAEGLN